MTYLFVAGKEFPHWNRRTGTHGNHCYQYTDRNQIDHFAVRSCSFSVQLLFVFILRLNNSLLLCAPFFYFFRHSLSLLNSFFCFNFWLSFLSFVFWFFTNGIMLTCTQFRNVYFFPIDLFGPMHFTNSIFTKMFVWIKVVSLFAWFGVRKNSQVGKKIIVKMYTHSCCAMFSV